MLCRNFFFPYSSIYPNLFALLAFTTMTMQLLSIFQKAPLTFVDGSYGRLFKTKPTCNPHTFYLILPPRPFDHSGLKMRSQRPAP